MARGSLSHPVPFWLLTPLALAAGLSTLLQLLLAAVGLEFEYGAAAGTQTAVLACFMAGFGIGAFALGFCSDALKSPLRWAGVLQLLLAGWWFAAPGIAETLIPSGTNPTAGLLTTGLALLVVPGILAGGTINLLVRAGAHTTQRGAATLGAVMGANALGGAAAMLVLAGMGPSAAMTALVLQGATGLAMIGISIAMGPRAAYGSQGATASKALGAAQPAAIFTLVVIGILIPAQRFGWGRVLAMESGTTGDGLAVGMLLHMLGLGLGSILAALMVATGQDARRLLARVVLIASILVVLPLFVAGMLAGGAPIRAALLILPGALGTGLVLPIVARVALADREAIGKQVGGLLFLLASGWTLSLALAVPAALATLPSSAMVLAGAALLVVAGTLLAFAGGLREWVPAGAAALVLVLGLLNAGSVTLLSSDGLEGRRLLAEKQGVVATYDVVENTQTGELTLLRDGRRPMQAGGVIGARMLAHLPLLLHPKPVRVLVADFGSGVVAGAVSAHPETKQIDCVDDEDTIFALAPAFESVNGDVLAKPTVRTTASMLRPFLRANAETYDVIMFQPRAPTGRTGTVRYTDSFYALASAALKDGGILCQRLPTHAWDAKSLQRVVAAANANFAFVSLWDFADGVLLLAGSKAPTLDAQQFAVRAAAQSADLQAARIRDPVHLLASYVCDGDTFAGKQAEALQDGQRLDPTQDSSRVRRENLVRCSGGSAAPWMGKGDSSLGEAFTRAATLRRLMAEDVPSVDALARLADETPLDLRAHAAEEQQRYAALVAAENWAHAARLTLVRDRSIALTALANSLEGERQHYYDILSVRDGANPGAEVLARLSASLSGPERLYVENRARMQRGETRLPGEVAMPDVSLRDPLGALKAADEEALRMLILDAECGRLLPEFDKVIWEWWKSRTDPVAATLMLHAAGWRQSLRAARRLAGKGTRVELIQLAPLFAASYPGDRTWERLCQERHATVRAAAAEAARAQGTSHHVAQLVALCSDKDRAVRTGAFLSLQGILGDAADACGYDVAAPSDAAIAKLTSLVPTSAREAAAPEEK